MEPHFSGFQLNHMKAIEGRGAGVPNYKNDVLVSVIESVMPIGPAQWDVVASRYRVQSGETVLQEAQDIKRHFSTNKNLNNCGKVPTGASHPSDMTARWCQTNNALSGAGNKFPNDTKFLPVDGRPDLNEVASFNAEILHLEMLLTCYIFNN